MELIAQVPLSGGTLEFLKIKDLKMKYYKTKRQEHEVFLSDSADRALTVVLDFKGRTAPVEPATAEQYQNATFFGEIAEDLSFDWDDEAGYRRQGVAKMTANYAAGMLPGY